MRKITPFLWFNNNAEEAAEFYCSVFDNAKIGGVTRYTEAGQEIHQQPVGSVMTLELEMGEQKFTALNGGPHFQFTPAISFVVPCQSQDEVDRFWNALSEGGEIMACGWVTDKFGVTWQIVPQVLLEMLRDPDTAKAKNVTQAMLQMEKLDIQKLQDAYAVTNS